MKTDKISLTGAPSDIERIEVDRTAAVWATTASGSTRRVATLTKEQHAAVLLGERLTLNVGEAYDHAYDNGDVGPWVTP